MLTARIPCSRVLPLVRAFRPLALGLVLLLVAIGLGAQTIRLDPRNPHYFFFHGHPMVLLTSGEHYGAVLNDQFDFRTYLRTLQADHLNLTRTFSGEYREVPGSFHIDHNTLAPLPGHFLAPWARSGQPGAADGGNKFDLDRWNPAYFRRLEAFVAAASGQGVVVEFTLFCPFYEDSMWRMSPLNALNNVNHIGAVPRVEVYTLQHARLQQVQDRMVRELVRHLNRFDNVMFEICNEPYFGGVTLAWQHHIASVIASTEAKLPNRHLITQNIANNAARVAHPDPLVSVLNFHYGRPAAVVGLNFNRGRVIGNNETGFDGQADATYRVQAWAFLFAGGGLFNNLDYSFVAGHEQGDFAYGAKTPGGGSVRLRDQLKVLADLFGGLDLNSLHPAPALLAQPVSDGATAGVLTQADGQTLVYLHHGRLEEKHGYRLVAGPHQSNLWLTLPQGNYRAVWLDPATGRTLDTATVHSGGAFVRLQSPVYPVDLLLRLRPLQTTVVSGR